MKIDDDGVIRFQEGGLAYDHLARYMEAGGGKDERAGGGPNDPNFNWGLYNSLVRDPYMGGYTGFGPDLTAALEGSLNPTGIMLDQDAISKAIADYQASLTPATPASKLPTGFTSQDILDYFNTPGLTPLQAAQTMQQYNVQPEDIASILGLTPEDARAQYNAALAPFAQATAPPATVTAPPVRTLDDDIRDFFATGPTAQEVFDAMQANNVSPEAVINAMGFDPVEAMAEYNMFLNPANAPTVTDTEEVGDVITGGAAAPTTATGPGTIALPGAATGSLFDLLPGPVQGAVTGVGDLIGGVGNIVGRATNAFLELIGAPVPSLVVLNPTTQSGTIIFGKPTGSATPTIVGKMPNSGAPVGVYTGNPFIDGVLQKVFSKSPPGQSGTDLGEIIKVVVLEEIDKATGANVGAIAAAARGDVQGLIDATTKVVLGIDKDIAKLDEKYKTQEEINRAATGTDQVTDLLEREPTNVDVTDPFPLEPGGTTTGSETDDLINLIGGPGPDMGPNKVIDLVGGPGPDMGPIRTTTTTTPATGTDTDDLINLIGGPGPDMGPIKTTATDTTKKVGDDTTVTDDTTKKVGDDTTVTDDTTEKVVDDTTVTDDTTEKVGDDTTVVEEDDTTEKVVDDTTVTDDTTEKVGDDTTVVEEDDTTEKVGDDTTVVEEDDTTKKKVDDTTVVEEDVPPKVVSPDGPVTPPKVTTVTPPGTPGVIPTLIRQPQTAQGMYSVGTEQAGVADIGTQYDLNASLLENIMRILSESDAGAEETELYGGGSVNGYNATDELIKLLRG
jgi:hypothetical protein